MLNKEQVSSSSKGVLENMAGIITIPNTSSVIENETDEEG